MANFKTLPFKLNKFTFFSSSKYATASFILIIEIISSKLSLKKILLLLILILLFENFLLVNSFNSLSIFS